MRGVALLVVLVWSVDAAAGPCRRPFETQLAPDAHDSVSAALEAVASWAGPASARADAEYAGAVLRDGGGRVRISWGAGCAARDALRFRVPVVSGSEIVAFWHTHGAPGWARGAFSAADARVVKQFGLPFYLIDPNGEVRVLSPENLSRTRLKRRRESLIVVPGYAGELARPAVATRR